MITTKYYVKFAGIFAQFETIPPEQRYLTAQRLIIELFQDDNERFNLTRFKEHIDKRKNIITLNTIKLLNTISRC
jgi:hypothetical protein